MLIAVLLVRVPAVTTLPMDSDEPIYLDASAEIAEAIRDGDWWRVSSPSLNREHPGLVKFIYGMGQVVQGTNPDLIERLAVARSLSMEGSLATIAVVAWFHPVAGLALATHTLHAKYGVQAYLDGLPVFWMSVAMMMGWRHRHSTDGRWLLLSGTCWGAALAGKWLHGIPGLALLVVLPDWRSRLRMGLTVILSWWVLDPSMGTDPIARLTSMMASHHDYAEQLSVATTWVDPLVYLASGLPSIWHPDVFPVSVDSVWFGLGIVGLILSARKAYGGFLLAWFALPLVVLMLWETRWPQHAMVMVVPLCIGVGRFVESLASRASLRFGPIGSLPPASE